MKSCIKIWSAFPITGSEPTGSAHRKVTLADVAREAGVSAATVSRLMRGGARVTAETRERILRAAQRLDFDLESRKTSRIIAFMPERCV